MLHLYTQVQIVNFLRDHWQLISFILVIILEIVLLIVKRFKVIVKMPDDTLEQLITYVKDAEDIYGSGHGEEKLNYVIKRYFQENDFDDSFKTSIEFCIKLLVEQILSTPQKKGLKDESKK